MVTMPGQNGGPRIPFPPIGVQAPGEDLPQRKEINRLVLRGPVGPHQSPVATVKETRLDEHGVLVEITTVYSATCKSCGKQMKSENDVGGMCPCEYVVCSDCIRRFDTSNEEGESYKCPTCPQ